MKYLPLLLLTCCTGEKPSVITYNNTVRTLMQQNCTTCHGPNSANGDWTRYASTITKKDQIYYRVVVARDMPKSQFMTENARDTIRKWIDQGALE